MSVTGVFINYIIRVVTSTVPSYISSTISFFLFFQVVNKWFALQAMSDIPGNVESVRRLLDHPAFDLRNPNKVIFCARVVRCKRCLCLHVHPFSVFLSKGYIEIWILFLGQVYSLIGGFCGSPMNFHAKDGSGYKFLGEMVVQLDKINPQVCLKHVWDSF